MGICKYCGNEAGFLRGKHPECHKNYLHDISTIQSLIEKINKDNSNPEYIITEIENVKKKYEKVENKIDRVLVEHIDNCIAGIFAECLKNDNTVDNNIINKHVAILTILKQHAYESFSNELRECISLYIRQTIAYAIIKHDDVSIICKSVMHTCENLQAPKDIVTEQVVEAINVAIAGILEDGLVSENEERKVYVAAEFFAINVQSLSNYLRLVQGTVLFETVNGIISQRFVINETIPFNLQREEKLIWLFKNVQYYEIRTRTQYVGGSSGVSVRIAKGLYYRTSSFKGYPVQKSEMVLVDAGILGITQKHIYFSGNTKAFRIQYQKIVSFTPYSDGIGIQKDASTAKPQIFVTNDGWFTNNLIQNVAKIF